MSLSFTGKTKSDTDVWTKKNNFYILCDIEKSDLNHGIYNYGANSVVERIHELNKTA